MALLTAGLLPDYLQEDLDIIFVGFNPGIRSGKLGHHYAGHSNLFWRLLAEAGFTAREFEAEEEAVLQQLGYGLTNVLCRTTASSTDLEWAELLEGGQRLRRKLRCYRPRVAALLGKNVYRAYAGLNRSIPVEWGRQKQHQLCGVVDFVAPHPSGRSTVPYEKRLSYFCQLHELARSLVEGNGSQRG